MITHSLLDKFIPFFSTIILTSIRVTIVTLLYTVGYRCQPYCGFFWYYFEKQIATKQHVWYFKKEEIWKDRWMEAKSLLTQMKAKREKAKKEAARARARSLTTRREIGLTGLSPAVMKLERKEMSGQLGAKEPEQNTKSSNPGTRSWPVAVDIKEYRCSKCNGFFAEADMVMYKLNTKEGVCHDCIYGKK